MLLAEASYYVHPSSILNMGISRNGDTQIDVFLLMENSKINWMI